jgi:DNA-binding HxlR family transcriptional regulator
VKRNYRQYCGLARALDLVGERWTLLLVRNLLLGPKRYRDLLAGLPGITTNLLAQRLREMEEAGLVRRVVLPPPASTEAYDLTDLGRELEPAVHALGAFGTRHLLGPFGRKDRFDLAWGLLSLKRRYRGGPRAVLEIRLGEERVFQVRTGGAALEVREEVRWEPSAILKGKLPAIRELLFLDGSLDELLATGALALTGDRAAARRLLASVALTREGSPERVPKAPPA